MVSCWSSWLKKAVADLCVAGSLLAVLSCLLLRHAESYLEAASLPYEEKPLNSEPRGIEASVPGMQCVLPNSKRGALIMGGATSLEAKPVTNGPVVG